MIKYIGAAAALAAAYGIEGAVEIMVVALGLLAAMFYTMTFRLFAGLSQATVNGDPDLLHMATIYMIYITMAVLTFYSPYAYVALIALPWLVIQTAVNILSVLIKLDIIGIEHK